MLSFLFGYYLLPEGFMRGTPQFEMGRLVSSFSSFWSQFGLLLLFNLGIAFTLCVLANLQQVYGIPMGSIVLVILGITSGLIAGTNSFSASDLKQFNALDGTALGMSIGGVEMIAYVLAVSATFNIGVANYTLRQWKGEKIKTWREIRLCTSEIIFLCLGIILLIVAAYRETKMTMP